MALYKPTAEELKNVLELHAKWLRGEEGGKKADMSGWDLSYSDLRSANLRSADLYSADLRSADLRSADLRSANLYSADLRSADLRSANLRSADLRSADLRSAKNLSVPLACPDTGAFTAWKKCRLPNGSPCIVELLIPADARRSSATTRKCRCDKAEVVSITGMKGASYKKAHSARSIYFVYEVGKTVSVPDFDENRWNECSTGIHFFITRQEAIER